MSPQWLLIDRDDTILDDPGYLSDPEKLVFLPGAIEGLLAFFEAGWPLVVLTNQSGIGRGLFGWAELDSVHLRFQQILGAAGLSLAGIYICPHAPNENCPCRKPQTALAEQAAQDLGLALPQSVMVGDKESDLALGKAIGSAFVAQIVAKAQPSSLADGHFQSLQDLAKRLL